MSTALVEPSTTTNMTTTHSESGGGVRGLLAGEWVKLRSLRSTWLTLGLSLLAMVLLGWLFSATADSAPTGNGQGGLSTTDPVVLSLSGSQLAQLAIGVLGVLLVTGEYTSGTLRSTFAAVPRRWPVVAAKAAVLSAVVFVSSLVAAVVSFLIGQAALGDLGVGITAAGVPRVLVGTALYLTAIGLLGMALGWLLRATAGAVAGLFGVIFLLPVLGQLLPSSWGDVVSWLPSEAGAQLMQLTTSAGELGPWTGFAVLCGYLVVAFAGAVALLRRRDA